MVANGLLSLEGATPRALATILAIHLAYVIFVRRIEQRSVHELSWKRAPQELAVGVASGVAGIAAIVSILWIPGYYRVVGSGSVAALFIPVIVTAATVYTEEIVIRGVVFRLLEEGLGTWIALTLSALVFGFLHLGNDDATITGVLAISSTAGLLLAGVYILTRRLWLAIGIHFAVNWTQGAVFGLPVSGGEREGFLQGILDGPELLTGGPFGIEASLVMLVLGSVAAAYVLHRAHREGQIIHPPWLNRRHPELMVK